MALRAVVEPRLINAMKTPERKETRMALRGIGWLGGIWTGEFVPQFPVTGKRGFHNTLDSQGENGSPPSRANDQICREAVAISLITAQTSVMMMMATMTLVPTRLFVVL